MEIYTDSDWTEWGAFTSNGAKEEQVWLQVCLPFIKQLPMQFFSCIIMYLNISMPLWCQSENTPNETDVFTPADRRCIQSDPNWATVKFLNVDLIFNILPNYGCVLQVFGMWVCICQWKIFLTNELQITLFTNAIRFIVYSLWTLLINIPAINVQI